MMRTVRCSRECCKKWNQATRLRTGCEHRWRRGRLRSCRNMCDGVLLVSEEEIVATMKLVAQRMKIVIEPSSAVALAPLLRAGRYRRVETAKRADGSAPKIGVIFSGGNVEMGG